ncbi:amidohydrolase [Flavisolibacter tropicus]|uniref:N-acyl-L-amino acid amidohydrolase n=1 Tax=Flavisolibacter tropicus TaxID=1492898 RepID=A0A172TYF3_9BACT|nr:amidohydrolase [Flavisolibacter tropicus]ANE51767.1 N-acyl-L-amino acid amidohydrolase [Flavisolibacter tropicus]
MRNIILTTLLTSTIIRSEAQTASVDPLDALVKKLEPKTIAWRRDFHQHPELGNREFRTAKIVAQHLRSLGLEVKEGVGKTGVVGILKGGKPGPVVGLRADMDALPVTERVDLPFASKEKTTYNGQEVGVMHACGHDTHVAMLMTAAEILSGMKNDLAGTVKFVFQPAEEGAPAGEEGGAALMIKEGVLDNPKVDAMFGLHINAQTPVGQIKYREKGMMAESDWFSIKIKGRQSHGAQPWLGIDPVAIGAQIINSLQTIVSRQSDLTQNPVVISTTVFKGGVRENIIPEEATLSGTIRTLDKGMRDDVWARIERTAKNIAEASGATAEVTIEAKTGVTYNDPKLTQAMLPSLQKATNGNAQVMNAVMGAEDFSFFSEKIPSLYLYVGGMSANKDPKTTAAHHTPDFQIDESGMKTGVKTLVQLVLDYSKVYKKSI